MALSGIMMVIISSAERAKVPIAKWLAGNIWGADWPSMGNLTLAACPHSFYIIQSRIH